MNNKTLQELYEEIREPKKMNTGDLIFHMVLITLALLACLTIGYLGGCPA